MITRRALSCALLSLAACTHIGLQRRPVEIQRNTFTTTSGLKYEELFLGQGLYAATGNTVTFDYTVWLENGERVDSTLDRGVPLTVELGSAPVPGLNTGLVGMQSGGRRRLTVPPSLGYGSEGMPDMIPPDATLIFEVHMLEVSGG